MEKVIRLVTLLLLLAGPGPAWAVDSICGANAYIDEVIISADAKTTVCACLPGFARVDDRCERQVPAEWLERATLMLPQLLTGDVSVSLEENGERIPVSGERMFYANLVVVGATGQLTAYLDNRMRLRLSANSELRLGELLPDNMLVIDTLKGMLRLDNHPSPEDARWVEEKLGRARAWLKKTTSRRLTLRSTNTSLAVRGTDFSLDGLDNGDILVRLYSGELKLEALLTGKELLMTADQVVMVPADGAMPYRLTRAEAERFRGRKAP